MQQVNSSSASSVHKSLILKYPESMVHNVTVRQLGDVLVGLSKHKTLEQISTAMNCEDILELEFVDKQESVEATLEQPQNRWVEMGVFFFIKLKEWLGAQFKEPATKPDFDKKDPPRRIEIKGPEDEEAGASSPISTGSTDSHREPQGDIPIQ